MVLAEVEDKREFLRGMSRAISEGDRYSPDVSTVVIGFGIFIGFLVLLNWLYKNRQKLKGRVIRLVRRLKGVAVGKARYQVKVEIILDVPFGGEKVWRTLTSNLSPAGMFVKLNPPLKPRELFKFRLSLPGVERIVGAAEVMWVQEKWTEHHPSGSGCKFTVISEEDRNRIRLWIQKNKPPRAI